MKQAPAPDTVSLGVGALAGAASALIFVAGLRGGTFGSLFLFTAPLILFLAGMGWGRVAVLVAAIGATAVVVAAAGPSPGIVYAALAALAPLVVVPLALSERARAQDPQDLPGTLLLALAALGGLILLALLGGAELSGGIAKIVTRSIGTSPNELAAVERELAARNIHVTPADLASLVARVLPVAFAAGWMMVSAVTGLLAQEILARSGRALVSTPPYSCARLPRAAVVPFVACIGLCFVPGWIGLLGTGLVTLFGLVYFFLGLAVIHAKSRRLPARPLMLGALYLCLALFVVTAAAVALLGLVDQFADFRGRGEDQNGR